MVKAACLRNRKSRVRAPRVVENVHIEPVWSEGPILPSRLVDIFAGGQDTSDDDDTSDDEPDFDVAFSSNDNDDDYNN